MEIAIQTTRIFMLILGIAPWLTCSLACASPISYSETSGCLNYPLPIAQLPVCSSPPGFFPEILDVGVNRISGRVMGTSAGPSPGNYQDFFFVQLPVGLSVTAIDVIIANYDLPSSPFASIGAIQMCSFMFNYCYPIVDTGIPGNGKFQLMGPVPPGSDGSFTNLGSGGGAQHLRTLIYSPNDVNGPQSVPGAMDYSVEFSVGVAFVPEPSSLVLTFVGCTFLCALWIRQTRLKAECLAGDEHLCRIL